jgi:hypothetical protein
MLKAKLPKLITIQEDTNSSTNSLPLREQLVELFNTIDEGRFVSLKRVSQKTIDKLRYGKGGGRMLSTVMLVLSQL